MLKKFSFIKVVLFLIVVQSSKAMKSHNQSLDANMLNIAKASTIIPHISVGSYFIWAIKSKRFDKELEDLGIDIEMLRSFYDSSFLTLSSLYFVANGSLIEKEKTKVKKRYEYVISISQSIFKSTSPYRFSLIIAEHYELSCNNKYSKDEVLKAFILIDEISRNISENAKNKGVLSLKEIGEDLTNFLPESSESSQSLEEFLNGCQDSKEKEKLTKYLGDFISKGVLYHIEQE